MFRTSCLGASPAWASTCTSLTSPSGVVTTRAERIPSRLVSRFSARRTPQGSGMASGDGLLPGGGGPCGLLVQGPVTRDDLEYSNDMSTTRSFAALGMTTNPPYHLTASITQRHSVPQPSPDTAPGRRPPADRPPAAGCRTPTAQCSR